MPGLPTCFGRPTYRTSETCRTSETSHYTLCPHMVSRPPKVGRISDGLRTSDMSDVRTPPDVRYLCHWLLPGIHQEHFGRPIYFGRPTFEFSDVRSLTDVRHFHCQMLHGHFGLWTISTPSPPLERVDHFTLHSPKNTSAPSHSLLHQISDPGEILESSCRIFQPVIDPALPHLSTKANRVLRKS